MKLIPYGKLLLRTHFSVDKVEKIIGEHAKKVDIEKGFYAQRAGIFMGKIVGNKFAIGPLFCWRLCGQTMFIGEVKEDDEGTYLDIVTRGSYAQCAFLLAAFFWITWYSYNNLSIHATIAQVIVFLGVLSFFVHCFWEDVNNFKAYLCEILEAREPGEK